MPVPGDFGINAARQQPTLTRRDTALAPLIYSEPGTVDWPTRLPAHAEAERIAPDLPVASRTLLPLRATDGRARLSFVAELVRSTVIWEDQYFREGAPSGARGSALPRDLLELRTRQPASFSDRVVRVTGVQESDNTTVLGVRKTERSCDLRLKFRLVGGCLGKTNQPRLQCGMS